MYRIVAVVLAVLTAALGIPATTFADPLPPDVPTALSVPAGHALYLIAHAEGTQNYICTVGPGGFAWGFFGPQATLVDAADQQVMTHFLSPNPAESGAARATWQHSTDSSAIWAASVAASTDPSFVAPGAIPWLLLRVVGTTGGPTGGEALAGTAYIQRVHTAGGVAPAAGCRTARDVGKKALVPYSTDYAFYR